MLRISLAKLLTPALQALFQQLALQRRAFDKFRYLGGRGQQERNLPGQLPFADEEPQIQHANLQHESPLLVQPGQPLAPLRQLAAQQFEIPVQHEEAVLHLLQPAPVDKEMLLMTLEQAALLL